MLFLFFLIPTFSFFSLPPPFPLIDTEEPDNAPADDGEFNDVHHDDDDGSLLLLLLLLLLLSFLFFLSFEFTNMCMSFIDVSLFLFPCLFFPPSSFLFHKDDFDPDVKYGENAKGKRVIKAATVNRLIDSLLTVCTSHFLSPFSSSSPSSLVFLSHLPPRPQTRSTETRF